MPKSKILGQKCLKIIFQIPSGLSIPLKMTIPAFSEEELVEVIAKILKDQHDNEIAQGEEDMEVDDENEPKKKIKLELEFFLKYVNTVLSKIRRR